MSYYCLCPVAVNLTLEVLASGECVEGLLNIDVDRE
jgi:hypothetical protein